MNLSANNLPAGTTVTVTCKTKKKKQQKKGCPYKSKRFKTSAARARLNLRKPFRKQAGPGRHARSRSRSPRPASIGKQIKYTIRKRKIPKSRVRCIPPGGKAGQLRLIDAGESAPSYSRKGRSNSVESTIWVWVRVTPGRSRSRSSVSSRWAVSRARTCTTALASPATV